ncbi:sulfotransferase [Leisingera aquaemixtae]|uniref:sulfotransferase n=1 Tax=Leisingera aquaemixtae TaxID=1396826 RepID=UPI001C971EFA|nr:sulfotransferase [Leisingera aquaemixtae]MBY6069086.1 sulfotransferase [Leisingera aquaemixtae]
MTDLKFAFIITYGRSGSTLLQGVLNSLEGTHILGENGNLIQYLFEMQKKLDSIQHSVGENKWRTEKDPFFGIDYLTFDLIAKATRSFVTDMAMASWTETRPPRMVGFKEIRYPHMQNPQEMLNWMRRVFPEAIFIFNKRSLDNVLNSGMFLEHSDEARKELRKQFEAFDAIMSQHDQQDQNSILLDYDTYRDDAAYISESLSRVGITIPTDLVATVMEKKHSYTWKGK